MKTFGGFGDTAGKVGGNRFFDWFQLEPTQETAGAGETVFRPGGEAFHALVSLTSRAGPDGRLTGLSLKVARSFIEDPRQGAFARDIVKSFLETVSPGAPVLAPLIDEIFFRAPSAPMMMRGEAPRLADQPSPGFLVFAGERAAWSTELPNVTLTFTNADEGAFVVRAEPRAARGGWLSRLTGSR